MSSQELCTHNHCCAPTLRSLHHHPLLRSHHPQADANGGALYLGDGATALLDSGSVTMANNEAVDGDDAYVTSATLTCETTCVANEVPSTPCTDAKLPKGNLSTLNSPRPIRNPHVFFSASLSPLTLTSSLFAPSLYQARRPAHSPAGRARRVRLTRCRRRWAQRMLTTVSPQQW